MRFSLLVLCLCSVLSLQVAAFNPPEARDQELSLRIEGPDSLTDVTVPVSYTLHLQNTASTAVRCTVDILLIDGWQVDGDSTISFSLTAGENARHTMVIQPAATSVSGLYPLTVQCPERGLKAIKLIETKLPLRNNIPPRKRYPLDTPSKIFNPFWVGEEVGHLEGVITQGNTAYTVTVIPGAKGLLDATYSFRGPEGETRFTGFYGHVAGGETVGRPELIHLFGARSDIHGNNLWIAHRFEQDGAMFDLVGRAKLHRNALSVKFWLSKEGTYPPWQEPYIESIMPGDWNQPITRIFAGVGNVVEQPEKHQLHYDGHQLASSVIGLEFESGPAIVQAVYPNPNNFVADPALNRATLHGSQDAYWIFVPGASAFSAAKTYRDRHAPTPPATIGAIAGRFTFDLWGGHYAPAAENLEKAFRYGLTNSVVVWHNWQRHGYDYRLPDIVPPNPKLGSQADFLALAETCKAQGVLFAPHDNYIDIYPDSTGFSYDNVSFWPNGTAWKAWFNTFRQAQSYRWNPRGLRPALESNVQWLKEHIGPDAYFIDVWTSIRPDEVWTRDGALITRKEVTRTWEEAFDWIRDTLGDAPQISESGHDALIGHVDAAQVNHLRVDAHPPKGAEHWAWRWKCADAERIPWLDFFYHDSFILQGAGYSSRYAGGLDAQMHGIYSDDYIATEVLTGHPAMVSEAFGRQVVRKYWLTDPLARALALQRIDDVQFVGGDIHRQQIRWSNGVTVWVNRGESPWTIEGHTLPQYGFLAQHGELELALTEEVGQRVEWCMEKDSIYLNPRNQSDSGLPITTTVASFTQQNASTFQLELAWEARTKTDIPYLPFLHFTDPETGEILFQASHQFTVPTDRWSGTVTVEGTGHIPEALGSDFEVELRAGLYLADHGRLRLSGLQDNQRRIRLGTLTGRTQNGVRRLEWTPMVNPYAQAGTHTLARHGIRTDGACRIAREDAAVTVTPLPDSPEFTVRITPAAFAGLGASLTHWEAFDLSGTCIGSGQFITTEDDGTLVLNCDPDVFQYRLVKP